MNLGTRPASRWLVPGVPFLISLGLSLSTAGSTVFWQDSGFFLTAVHELSVLYPHGFVLYLLLCKAWTTLVAPLAGFALAVHLFSAFCAAGAAAFLASACRAFLRRLEPAADADRPALAAGCLVAAGYSFGSAAILAKPYALFYLGISALLWLMAVAERKRDFLALGALLGLCWAAHPSAALLLPAMLTYAAVRRDRVREWGWGFFGAVAGLAAACAFLPELLLPVLAARESPYSFGDPRSAGDVLAYVFGKRFVASSGAFGFQGDRWTQASGFFWEEYLGVGLALLGVGAWRVLRDRPKALPVGAAWVGTVAFVSLLFRGEGQFDLWLVSAYLPLSLLTAAGIQTIARRGAAFGIAAAAAGGVWMVAANHADLNQRHYIYAEQYARLLLKNLDPNAMLILRYDDSVSTVSYLQTAQSERRDVVLVSRTFLGLDWYDRILSRAPGVRIPNWEQHYRAMVGVRQECFDINAFANENAGPGRPVFTEVEPDPRYLRADLALVPAGMLWKIAPRGEAVLDPKYWDLPADLTALARDIRRPRGVMTRDDGKTSIAKPEPFEHRLILRLLHARLRLADAILESAPRGALEQYEVVRRVWPAFLADPRFLGQWGRALFLVDKAPDAARVFEALLGLPEAPPASRAQAYVHLAAIALAQGKKEEARARLDAAHRSGPVDEAMRKSLEERLGPR